MAPNFTNKLTVEYTFTDAFLIAFTSNTCHPFLKSSNSRNIFKVYTLYLKVNQFPLIHTRNFIS